MIEGQDDLSKAKLTLTSALGLIGMVKALVTKKLVPAFNENLVNVLLNIAHNISSDENLYPQKAIEVHEFIKKLKNYDSL